MKTSLGSPIPNGAEPLAPTPVAIDLGIHQRAVMAQLQQDQQRLTELDQERTALIARINAGRGKLELIALLAQEAGPTVTSGEEWRATKNTPGSSL